MKLCIKNFGPIDNVEINVDSDLTFIYGKNDIGKSYAITLLYLFLKKFVFEFLRTNRYSYMFFSSRSFIGIYKNMVKNVKKIKTNYNEFDVSGIVTECLSKYISNVFLPDFEDSLRNSFGGNIAGLRNKISDNSFEIYMDFEEYGVKITEKDGKLNATYDGKGKKYIYKEAQKDLLPKVEKKQVTLYYTQKNNQLSEGIRLYFSQITKYSILAKISSVYCLPASRSGLYRALSAFSQIIAELAKKRNFLRKNIFIPSISELDSDYFSKINEINTKLKNYKFNIIAEKIEKNILKGDVSFDQRTKKISFHPNNVNKSLELLGTSSMVAEVSPIVLYLRYIVSERSIRSGKPIIFIEEPEAHLHPETQILLLERFVDLVKAGAKLVITSHSDYMFNKLNKLIAEKKVNKNLVNGTLLNKKKKGSRSQKIHIDDKGMKDYNFEKAKKSVEPPAPPGM